MSASTRIKYQGKTINSLSLEIIHAAEELLGYKKGSLTIVQGSYNGGGVKASAGTHDGGGALDLTASDWTKKEKVFRLLGCAAWKRPALRGVWSDHVHLIVDGDTTASSGAKYQVTAYHNRRNGLANNASDPGYRMAVFPRFVFGAPKRRWVAIRTTQGYSQPVANSKYAKRLSRRKTGWTWGTPNVATVRVNGEDWLVTKSATFYLKKHFKAYEPKPAVKFRLRAMTYNLPGGDKIANPVQRVNVAYTLMASKSPDIIGLNELVGPGTDGGKASAFATTVHKAFGAGYGLVTPTTAYNENYVIYDARTLRLVKQYEDTKIYTKVGTRTVPGRHLTAAVFEHRATKRIFVAGVTHLVSGDAEGAHAQSSLVAAALEKISAKHGDAPMVLVGDMNITDDPKGFTARLENTRKVAKKTTHADYATYMRYSATRPVKGGAIDQIWTSKSAVTNGYTVVSGTTVLGNFRQPRPSDHLPVIVSVIF